MSYTKLSLLLAVLSLGRTGYAQQKSLTPAEASTTGTVWKKTVSRWVKIADSTDYSKKKLKPVGTEKPFSQILINAVLEGKITAYTTYESDFSVKLTPAQLKAIIYPKPDTLEIIDPVTGKTIKKVMAINFNFDEVVTYRLLEEWTFDRMNGKTTITTSGIGPVRDIWGEDGSYRGRQTMFWLKYADARSFIMNYDATHPEKNISLEVWKDYFDNEQ